MKTTGTSETSSCLQRFLLPSQKREIIYTDNSKTLLNFCQDLQRDHDTSTLHRSDTNGVAERAVRRVKGGTAIATVQSGLPEEWWDCWRWCSCYLRNAHHKMTDGKDSIREQTWQIIWPTINISCNIGSVHPNYRERQVNSTSVLKDIAETNILRLWATCGARLVWRLDDGRSWRFARIRILRNLRRKIQKPRYISTRRTRISVCILVFEDFLIVQYRHR